MKKTHYFLTIRSKKPYYSVCPIMEDRGKRGRYYPILVPGEPLFSTNEKKEATKWSHEHNGYLTKYYRY